VVEEASHLQPRMGSTKLLRMECPPNPTEELSPPPALCMTAFLFVAAMLPKKYEWCTLFQWITVVCWAYFSFIIPDCVETKKIGCGNFLTSDRNLYIWRKSTCMKATNIALHAYYFSVSIHKKLSVP